MITKYENICLLCGRPRHEIHHIVFGRGMRNLAEEDGLKIPLCSKCHKDIHYQSAAADLSKIVGQLQFERDYVSKKHNLEADFEEAREVFRQRYSRSYL